MKLIFFAMLLTLSSTCQSQKCLEVNILIGKTEFDAGEKKEILFLVKNKMNKTISLPEGLYEGRRGDDDAEFYLEVLRKESNGTYVAVERSNNDYQYVITNRKYHLLKSNGVIKYQADMDLLHDLKLKGVYKVRLVLRSDQLVACQLSESSWKEFEIH